MIEEKDVKEVGRFQKTHGLKGELNAMLDIEPSFFEEEENPLIVDMDGAFVPFYLESVRPKGSMSYLVKLDGVDTQEEAQEFVNHNIYAWSESLKDFLGDEDLIDLSDLRGFEVVDARAGLLGIVESVDDSTENVLLVVKCDNGEEIYIPVVDEFIAGIDEISRRISVDLPEGLLNLNVRKDE